MCLLSLASSALCNCWGMGLVPCPFHTSKLMPRLYHRTLQPEAPLHTLVEMVHTSEVFVPRSASQPARLTPRLPHPPYI